MTGISNILVIGAGELGGAVLRALAQHPNRGATQSSVFLRESTIASKDPAKSDVNESFRNLGIHLVPGDVVCDSQDVLATKFRDFDTVISCTGFVAGRGTQLKLARAVLAAGVARYIPWQFGVDYDVIGRGSAQDLFDEQLDVRDLLRSQSETKWLIVSTGMFTSFLFNPAFGIVDTERSVVRALGSWENRVTVTAPEDIGRLTAEMVLGRGPRQEGYKSLFTNEPVFVAGDTISYAALADLSEEITERPFSREVLTVEQALVDLSREPDNALHKYNVVFGQSRGVAWDVDQTWNHRVGVSTMTARDWAQQNLK